MNRNPHQFETETQSGPNAFELLKRDRSSRRAFLTRMGAAGLGLAAVSLLDGCSGGSSSGGGGNNGGGGNSKFPLAKSIIPGKNSTQQVLNYALTLEFLEADLYRQALNIASGKTVTNALDPAGPSAYTKTVGNGSLSSANADAGFAYLRDFAFVEAAHAEFLKTVLTSLNAPTVTPNPAGYQFNGTPVATIEGILTAILPLEETGVRAYLGAAGFIGDLATVQTAAAIYSTEARHSAAINLILGKDAGPAPLAGDLQVVPVDGTSVSNNTFEYYLAPATVVAAIQPFFKVNATV